MRIPFWVSIALLAVSIWIRLKLQESPVFKKIKEEGKTSRAPLTDSFLRYPNNKYVLLALVGATAGQGVVWYTGQFYALFFMQITLKLDFLTTYTLIGASLLLGTPFFIFFGWLSDKVGRLKIILLGCLIAAVTYFPMFQALTHYVNPALETFQKNTKITIATDPSTHHFNLFVGPWSKFSKADKVRDYFTKQGLSFESVPQVPGKEVAVTIGDVKIDDWDDPVKKVTWDDLAAKGIAKPEPKIDPATGQPAIDPKTGKPFPEPDPNKYYETAAGKTLTQMGYPKEADKSKVNYPMVLLILVIFVIYVTMVYGPIAAFLVELFPTRIRYTSMSLPYHIGNGWFGGMLPLTATAIVALKGDIYYGLWYPIIVALITVVVGGLFLKETKDRDISTYEH